METCAACHARRGELTGDLVPGEAFFDHFTLSIPDTTELFYPDGQVHEEDYEFTAFLGSRACTRRGSPVRIAMTRIPGKIS